MCKKEHNSQVGEGCERDDAVTQELQPFAKNDAKIIKVILDLGSHASAREAAAQVNELPLVNILVNNACTNTVSERATTAEGLESNFGCNHIGHFLFTKLIFPKLRAAAEQPNRTKFATRIVNLTSGAHAFSPVCFADLNWEGKPVPADENPNWDFLQALGVARPEDGSAYTGLGAYGQSKTANILFAKALTAKARQAGLPLLGLAVHPGVVSTTGAKNFIATISPAIFVAMNAMVKNLDQGASTTLVAALDPKLPSHAPRPLHLADNQFLEPKQWAGDSAIAKRLWHLSEELVGEKFEI